MKSLVRQEHWNSNRFAGDLLFAVGVVIEDACWNSGGSEVENEDAVFVDVGVVEVNGERQVYSVFADQALGVDDFAAAAARGFTCAVCISRCESCGFEADAVVYFVKKDDKGRWFVEFLIGCPAHRDLAFRIHSHINSSRPRRSIVFRKLFPICLHNALLFHR